MGNIISYPSMKRLCFAIYSLTKFVTTENLSFRNIIVPKGFVFDGVSLPWFVMFLFTHNELKRGIRASCFHDWMCENKDKFSRREATKILYDIWKQDGLGRNLITIWKPWVVYVFVEIYQICKGWR